jgi:predicted TIM-barrel fold metal-dependent hydrolase
MGIVIDAFAHVMPKSFCELLLKDYPTLELKELSTFTYFGDMQKRIRVLDKYKIDKQVLTLARPTIWMGMPAKLVSKMTPIANDAVAEVAGKYPGRFIPVGTLPVPSEEYLAELDRCMNELGMAGIQIVSNINGKPLDDPAFKPFFARANATKTPIWIHPQLQKGWSQQYLLDKIFGWPFDTTIAMARLVFSGIMEEFPNLNIVVHHMGGMVPYFSERIKGFHGSSYMPRGNFVPLKKDPLVYFRRFYGDSVLNGAVHAFECGYKFFGPRHSVFATDYPFGPKEGVDWTAGALRQMRAIDIPQKEKELILSGNLMRIIKKR